MKILILGVNGFIGSSLTDFILTHRDWSISGLDLDHHKVTNWLNHERFNFHQGSIFTEDDWITAQVQAADVVLPLVAIANPAIYVKQPLRVFELDFEANLKIVRLCHQYKKRLIFPSTSEVYGMCQDAQFDEEISSLVLGPINKQRWIYSCAKQMLDRVIYAYGFEHDFNYTLFRPFNWLGPKMDDIRARGAGSSRAVITFMSNVLHGVDIQLVNGGTQCRSFIYIDDAIDALIKIIENKANCASQQIFNIGNPANNISMLDMAQQVVEAFKAFPTYAHLADQMRITHISAQDYFGTGYQDTEHRVPSITKAQELLGWTPATDIPTALYNTLAFHLCTPV